MSNIPERDFAYLEELIRKVDGYLAPYPSDDYSYLYNNDIRDELYGRYPKCFMKIKGITQDISTILPICNRYGHKDKNVIDISRRVIKRLMKDENGKFDTNELAVILSKLDRMYSVYSKDVPRSPEAAAKKANVTRMFNNMKKYLDFYRGY